LLPAADAAAVARLACAAAAAGLACAAAAAGLACAAAAAGCGGWGGSVVATGSADCGLVIRLSPA
jgi:hypothetical protein